MPAARHMLLLLLAFAHGYTQAGPRIIAPDRIDGAITVSAEEVIKLLLSNPDIVLIDSRKPREYLKGHIENAVNLLNTSMSREQLQALAPDPQTSLLFYCNGPSCLRSSDAVNKALGWGYSHVFWFRGGWEEWIDKRFPFVTGP